MKNTDIIKLLNLSNHLGKMENKVVEISEMICDAKEIIEKNESLDIKQLLLNLSKKLDSLELEFKPEELFQEFLEYDHE